MKIRIREPLGYGVEGTVEVAEIDSTVVPTPGDYVIYTRINKASCRLVNAVEYDCRGGSVEVRVHVGAREYRLED